MEFAYRGEDGPKGGKPGRSPTDVIDAGGFAPWQAADIEQSRLNLLRLAGDNSLATEAEKWCLSKNRENGWFFSTGIDPDTAYDNYDHFYRIPTPALERRKWDTIGVPEQRGVTLYLDAPDLGEASLIAVIWKVRPKELLIMSPVGTDRIDLRAPNGSWLPLV